MNHSPLSPGDLEGAMERYGDMLYRICWILLKNKSDTEDVLQETFLKFYQKAPEFQTAEHEKAWLIRVATNNSRDILRFRLRHPGLEEGYLEKLALEPEESGILEALTALPEKYALVLTLHYIEGYRVADIAKIIRRTPSAVKMRLQKGRELLKEIYRKEYL